MRKDATDPTKQISIDEMAATREQYLSLGSFEYDSKNDGPDYGNYTAYSNMFSPRPRPVPA